MLCIAERSACLHTGHVDKSQTTRLGTNHLRLEEKLTDAAWCCCQEEEEQHGPDISSTRGRIRAAPGPDDEHAAPGAGALTIDKTIPAAGCAKAKRKDAFVKAQCVH